MKLELNQPDLYRTRWIIYSALLLAGAGGMMLFHVGVTDGDIWYGLGGAMLTYGSYTEIGIRRGRSRH